jgi:hypothetical protein
MKKTLLFVFALLLTSSFMFAQVPVEKKGKKVETKTETTQSAVAVVKKTTTTTTTKIGKGQKAIKGDIVNLLSAVTNVKAPVLTKEEAVGMAARGELLALKAGTKLYLIVMADGINASKFLAEKAGEKITLVGKVKVKGGVTMLIVDGI